MVFGKTRKWKVTDLLNFHFVMETSHTSENKQNVKIALSDLDELKIGYEPNGSQQLVAAGPAQVI